MVVAAAAAGPGVDEGAESLTRLSAHRPVGSSCGTGRDAALAPCSPVAEQAGGTGRKAWALDSLVASASCALQILGSGFGHEDPAFPFPPAPLEPHPIQ